LAQITAWNIGLKNDHTIGCEFSPTKIFFFAANDMAISFSLNGCYLSQSRQFFLPFMGKKRIFQIGARISFLKII
jgi:hypothetical protein